MDDRPVVLLEDVAEDVRLAQILHIDAFLEQADERILEQEVESIAILKLGDVFNYQLSGSDLIIVQGDVDGGDFFAVFQVTQFEE